jgi:hypothetical protein
MALFRSSGLTAGSTRRTPKRKRVGRQTQMPPCGLEMEVSIAGKIDEHHLSLVAGKIIYKW